MAILHIRNVPENLYKRIQKLVEEGNRSVTAEVIELLGQSVRLREEHLGAAEIVERIRRQAQKTALPRGWRDSADLLREDRGR